MASRTIHIAFIGDEKCGKSSIIRTFIHGEFQENVVPLIPETTFVSKNFDVNFRISDTPSKPWNSSSVISIISQADVICIVYNVHRHDTFESVDERWIPFVHSLRPTVPIIVVGNQHDQSTTVQSDDASLRKELRPLMLKHRQVEVCLRSSAKNNHGISAIFDQACEVILFSWRPLFDPTTMRFTTDFVAAIERIFRLCDSRAKHSLTDDDLKDWLEWSYKSSATPERVEQIKQLGGVFDEEGNLTLDGFVALHHRLFMECHASVWRPLSAFGYVFDATDRKLQLSDSFLHPNLDIGPNQTTELSTIGVQYFKKLFKKYQVNNVLGDNELNELFATSTREEPWISFYKRKCPTVTAGVVASTTTTTIGNKTLPEIEATALTERGFLALWWLLSLNDPHRVVKHAACLGFRGDPRSVILLHSIDRSQQNSKRNSQRKILRCFVIGSAHCGKTTMVRKFIDSESTSKPSFQSDGKPLSKVIEAVNFIGSPDTNNPKILALRGIPPDDAENYVIHEQPMREYGGKPVAQLAKRCHPLDECDVLCLMYDATDPHSFEFVANFHKRLSGPEHHQRFPNHANIPCLFLENKADLPAVVQTYEEDPTEYLSRNGLPKVTRYSILTQPINSIVVKLYELANNPAKAKASSSIVPQSLVLGGVFAFTGLCFAFYSLPMFSPFRGFFSSWIERLFPSSSTYSSASSN